MNSVTTQCIKLAINAGCVPVASWDSAAPTSVVRTVLQIIVTTAEQIATADFQRMLISAKQEDPMKLILASAAIALIASAASAQTMNSMSNSSDQTMQTKTTMTHKHMTKKPMHHMRKHHHRAMHRHVVRHHMVKKTTMTEQH